MQFKKSKRDVLDNPNQTLVEITVTGEESDEFVLRAYPNCVRFSGALTPPKDPAHQMQFAKDLASLIGLAFDEHTKLRKNLLSKLTQ